MKYRQRYDGDSWTIPSETIHRIVCCDCGLVHDMALASEDGKPIGIAFRRNAEATEEWRSKPSRREGA